MKYDYDNLKNIDVILKDVRERIPEQEKFMRGFLINFIIKPFYFLISRFICKEIGILGLENIDEIKKIKDEMPIIITYNHMFDFDILEIIYQLLKKRIFTANVAKHEFFNKKTLFEKFLSFIMENSGSFPVFLTYNNEDKSLYKRGQANLDRVKLNNFFNYFISYIILKKPVTIAINGSITRDGTFPQPENGLSFIIQKFFEIEKNNSKKLIILPVGLVYIGNLNEYNKILFDKEKYKNLLIRNIVALKQLIKKVSFFISFGKPIFLDYDILNKNQSLSLMREELTKEIYEKIKNEIKNIWDNFKIEERYFISLYDYLKN